jgi:hypothetical protein
LSQKNHCPDPDNAARQDIDTPSAHATPGEGSKQGECTLTGEEREAVATAMHAYGEDNADEECAKIEATLWGLLERMR